MTRLNGNTFIKTWQGFSKQFILDNPDWLNIYENNSEWSARFLGGKRSSVETSPIGDFFSKNLKGLRYRTEDGSFDLAFSFAENYRDFGGFYPTMYNVIIEVENNCKCAWQEMAKLIWVRSPLKVLVTYNRHPCDTAVWKAETKTLQEGFSDIIKQANEKFPENSDTEYLLIIGNNANNNLNWSFQIFNTCGNSL